MYDFDKVVNRYGTGCIKYDFKAEHDVPDYAMPLWVADMDFETAPEIVQAIRERAEHPIYGYTNTDEEFAVVVCKWFEDNYGYRFDKQWLVKTPGVVFALCMAIKAFTQPGDRILIQQPVYYPFARSIASNGRVVIDNTLNYHKQEGKYTIDFADFEKQIVENQVKMFILCNPHNPVGRVWTKQELIQMDEICRKHHVFVVADEIHCDFTYGEHRHTIFASLSEEAADNCMVCTAPSKTFNLAGLKYSSIFIPNKQKRELYQKELVKTGCGETNLFGPVAACAAYTKGKEWIVQLREYLAENYQFMKAYLEENMPLVKLVEMQGTYLAWIDCSDLGYTDEVLNHKILHEAGLWLDAGNMFGKCGEQFQRINIACPRSVLKEALEKLATIHPQ